MLTTEERQLLAMYKGAAGKEAVMEEVVKTIEEGRRVIDDPVLDDAVKRLQEQLESMSEEAFEALDLPAEDSSLVPEMVPVLNYPEGIEIETVVNEKKHERMELLHVKLGQGLQQFKDKEDE